MNARERILLWTTLSFGLAVSLASAQVRQAWVAFSTNDLIRVVKVDNAGNVHVIGDRSAITYNPSGRELWVIGLVGLYSVDSATVDDAGNFYAASTGNHTSDQFCERDTCFTVGYSDILTAKYDSNGTFQWQSVYNGAGKSLDYATAIVVGTAGNVYVGGYSGVIANCRVSCNSEGCDLYCSGESYFALVKYDANGRQLWKERYNGRSPPGAMTVDAMGNVYATGRSWGTYTTSKYNSKGDALWLVEHAVGVESPAPSALAVDDAGNLYVTGISRVWGRLGRYETVKYDSNGNELWAARGGPCYMQSYFLGDLPALALDAAGNAYVAGSSCSTNHADPYGPYDDCYYATAKYDANGSEVWVARYRGATNSSGRATSVATDGAGNVYVTGWSRDANGSAEYVTVKYDSNGNQLWAAHYRNPALGDAVPAAIALDASSNVCVSGSLYRPDGTFAAAVTLKYVQGPEFTATAVQPDGQFRFTLVGEAGRNYTIQVSTNLTTWTALTNFTSATGTNEFTDPAGPNNFSRRFYRAVSP